MSKNGLVYGNFNGEVREENKTKQTNKKNRDIKDITEIFAKRLYHLPIKFDVVRQ